MIGVGDREHAVSVAVARDAIRDLVARYNFHGDRGEVDRVASLFSVDGVLDVTLGGPPRVATGRVEIAALLRDVGAAWAADAAEHDRPLWVRHFVSTHVIDLTSDSGASGSAHVLVVRAGAIDAVARYFDTYTCRDGRWLLDRRSARRDTA